MEERIKVVIIAGATASSKSEIAFHLARELNGEIVNADSIQVYKYFDIGSAKPSTKMREEVPHHLIDILKPDQEFNAFIFKDMARKIVKNIASRGKLPIIVGGTGLYIRCFLYDLFYQDEDKIKYERRRLEDICEKEGLSKLYSMLLEVDPKAAEKIHPNDKIRIIRALEFYFAMGTQLSNMHSLYNFNNSSYDFKIFVPQFSKEEAANRMEERTKKMFQNGIVNEVKEILKMGYQRDIKPLKSIGYKEALMVVDGIYDEQQALLETIKNTKAYAKRQRIWFKKEKNTLFIPVSDNNFENFYKEVKLFLHKF